MLFKNEGVIFKGCKEFTSKKSGLVKKFSMVTIADPAAIETRDFFPADIEAWKDLEVGEIVDVALNYDGRFTNLVLL